MLITLQEVWWLSDVRVKNFHHVHSDTALSLVPLNDELWAHEPVHGIPPIQWAKDEPYPVSQWESQLFHEPQLNVITWLTGTSGAFAYFASTCGVRPDLHSPGAVWWLWLLRPRICHDDFPRKRSSVVWVRCFRGAEPSGRIRPESTAGSFSAPNPLLL